MAAIRANSVLPARREAITLHTAAGAYPIAGRVADFPAKSIRQIPGAFDRLEHRAAGRTLTLDAIEKAKLGQVIFYRQPELPAGTYTQMRLVLAANSAGDPLANVMRGEY